METEQESRSKEVEAIINKFYAFLKSIGISTIEREFDKVSFLPGLKIENGTLIINRQNLLYPGDILHEAGHIAVVPANERNLLNDNVTHKRPGKDGDEMAVMLWSYAACIYLDIDPEIVFHKDGYKGGSNWILDNYKNKSYMGLPLLKWMGMADDHSDDGFPKMIKWLRD